MNDTRTHSSYFTSAIEISGFSRSYFTHCCVRCPPSRLAAFRRTGRILLGFPAPWFDCPLPQQPHPRFCPQFTHDRLPCPARTSGWSLTSGARQPLSKSHHGLARVSGGAPPAQTKICANYTTFSRIPSTRAKFPKGDANRTKDVRLASASVGCAQLRCAQPRVAASADRVI